MNVMVLLMFVSFSRGCLYNLGEGYPNNISFGVIQENNDGILLCMDDNNKNSLCMSLVIDANDLVLFRLQFKEDHFSEIHLQRLCGCSPCTKIPLHFHLEMTKNIINISCNRNDVFSTKISARAKVTNYRIQYFMGCDKAEENTDLKGCLIDFTLRNETVPLENFGQKLHFSNCNKSCTKDICNRGKCIETYDSNIKCDCTQTLQNGKYCNDSGIYVYNSNILQWKIKTSVSLLKFSWNLSQTDFLILVIQTNVSTIKMILNNSSRIYFLNDKSNYSFCSNNEEKISNIMFIDKVNNSIKFQCNNGKDTFVFNMAPFEYQNINIVLSKGFIDVVYKNDDDTNKWIKPTFEEIPRRYHFEIYKLEFSYIPLVLVFLFVTGIISCYCKKKRSVICQKEVEEFVEPRPGIMSMMGDDYGSYESIKSHHSDYLSGFTEQNEYFPMFPTLPPRNILL